MSSSGDFEIGSTQLGGGCGDFIGVVDNRVGGGPAVIEIPKFELASDRLDELGDTYLEGGVTTSRIFKTAPTVGRLLRAPGSKL